MYLQHTKNRSGKFEKKHKIIFFLTRKSTRGNERTFVFKKRMSVLFHPTIELLKMRREFTKEIPTNIKNPNLIRERQDRIFKAALKLFSKSGYYKTSLRELSKETGISLGNIYDYIGRKSDILHLLYQKLAELASELWENRIDGFTDPVDKLRTMIEAELEIVDRYQDLVMVIYQESHAMDKLTLKTTLSNEESRNKFYKKVLDEGIKSGVFRPFNTVAVANIIKMMVDSWVLRRWALHGKVNVDEMRNTIMQFIERGILKSTS